MAAYCQARELAEHISLQDGMWVASPVDACRETPAYEVHVEHGIGFIVRLCTAHEVLVGLTPGYRKSTKLRPATT